MRINWKDLSAVLAYARQLGPGLVVVKHDARVGYNITHASRTDLYVKPGVQVLHRT